METENKAKITVEERVTAKSIDQAFAVFVQAFEDVGFAIWKKRPIAWLCISKINTCDQQIDANLVLRPTSPISLTLIMSSTTSSEEVLTQLYEKLLRAFYARLAEVK